MLLERLAQANAPSRVGVVVGGDGVKGIFGSLLDPFRRSEVHVSLAKVDTVRGEVGSTGCSIEGDRWPPSEHPGRRRDGWTHA